MNFSIFSPHYARINSSSIYFQRYFPAKMMILVDSCEATEEDEVTPEKFRWIPLANLQSTNCDIIS